MPQSMQRAPCFWSFSVGQGSRTCFQSRRRSSTGRYGCLSRLNSMNPVTLPMCCALEPCRRNALARAMRRVQLQGGARGPHARRTPCTLSVRPRAPTPQMGPYHRSSLLDHHERIARVDGLSHLDADLSHPARDRRAELVLHLHRLQHDEPVSGVHRLADLDLDVHDLARHRRLEHLATGRTLAAAGADDVAGLLLDADMIALAVHLDDGDAVLVAYVDDVGHIADQERPDALRRLPAVDLRDLAADGDAVVS